MSAGLGVGKRSSGGGRGVGSWLAGCAVGSSLFSRLGVPVGMRILEGGTVSLGRDGERKLGL